MIGLNAALRFRSASSARQRAISAGSAGACEPSTSAARRASLRCLRLCSLDFLDVVIKFLDTEHVAVIGQRDARLSVPHGLVHQLLNAGLAVEDRIL